MPILKSEAPVKEAKAAELDIFTGVRCVHMCVRRGCCVFVVDTICKSNQFFPFPTELKVDRLEEAKSGRAKCKACSIKIDGGEQRAGVETFCGGRSCFFHVFLLCRHQPGTAAAAHHRCTRMALTRTVPLSWKHAFVRTTLGGHLSNKCQRKTFNAAE